MSKNTAESLISFIKESPVSFHAVENITNRLSGEGYTALFESGPTDHRPPGSSVCNISQARILEWVAIPFSRGSS